VVQVANAWFKRQTTYRFMESISIPVFPKKQHHPHEYRGVETILSDLTVLFAQEYPGLCEGHTRLQNPIEIYI